MTRMKIDDGLYYWMKYADHDDSNDYSNELPFVLNPCTVVCRDQEGDIRILVSTNALEEGINVAECTWVVRFDKILGTWNRCVPRATLVDGPSAKATEIQSTCPRDLLQNQSI